MYEYIICMQVDLYMYMFIHIVNSVKLVLCFCQHCLFLHSINIIIHLVYVGLKPCPSRCPRPCAIDPLLLLPEDFVSIMHLMRPPPKTETN